jgi:hypothetical protein
MLPSVSTRLCRALLVLVAAVLLLPGVAFAQFDTATVLGTIKDSSGAVVPDRDLHRARRAAGVLGR